MKLVLPITAVGAALFVQESNFGLLNIIEIPFGVKLIVSVLILDFAIWLQHLLVHFVPILWRLHRVHHSDPEFDVTTAARFHPLEITFSMILKIIIVLYLGIPAEAVILFEVMLNGMAQFNHSNIQLPPALDRLLKNVLVTPSVHRIHHSVMAKEHNSNFGFNLSVWDRLFGTYIARSEVEQKEMVIGLLAIQGDDNTKRLSGMLLIPFRNFNHSEAED